MTRKMRATKMIMVSLGTVILTGATITNAQSSVGDIWMKFCNTPDQPSNWLNLILNANEEKEICMQFSNNTKDDLAMSYNFVDGTITNDSEKNKACKNEDGIANFGQYVSGGKNETFTIPAGEALVKKASIKFPVETKGTIHGCLTYVIKEAKQDTAKVKNTMFSILVRKAHFIDVLVNPAELKRSITLAENTDTKNLSNNTKIDITQNENKQYILSYTVKNDGSLDEKVKLTGKIKNIFWWMETMNLPEETLYTNTTKTISYTIKTLPFYKGPFTIETEISAQAVIDNTDGSNLPDALKTPIIISEKATIFLMNRYLVWYIVAGIIVLFFLIKLLKHIHIKITNN